MAKHPRIALDPDVLAGKPVIRGTRLAVEFVIGLLADGWSEAEIIANYPGVAHEDILACLAYARDVLSSEREGVPERRVRYVALPGRREFSARRRRGARSGRT